MENNLVLKIIEAESNADKIISSSMEEANKLVEDYKLSYSKEKKQIERKYDDALISGQEQIKKDLDEEFNNKLSITKSEVEKLKVQSVSKYDEALNILFSGVGNNGNS